jgi:hypothetical protein
MDTDDNSSTDSFIELINMQTSTIITKDKEHKKIFDTIVSAIEDCISPIYRNINYYIDLLRVNKSKSE